MELKHQHFAELFRSDFYTVSVVFDNEEDAQYRTLKEYTYKVPKDLNLEVNELIIVMVVSHKKETLKIVRVVSIHANTEIHEDNGFKYKWIVGRYSDIMKDHIANVARDNKLKIAVGKLEAALARVSLRKRIADAMETLDDATKSELIELFGPEIELPKQLEK